MTGRCCVASGDQTLIIENAVPSFPPVLVDDQAMVEAGEAEEIDVLANDTDPDGDLVESSLTIAAPPGLGTASVIDAGDGARMIRYEAGSTGGRGGADVVDRNGGHIPELGYPGLRFRVEAAQVGPSRG